MFPLLRTTLLAEKSAPALSTEVFAHRIAAAIGAGGSPPRVLKRVRNTYTSTLPTEVVTCELASGSVVQWFCKHFDTSGGHKHRNPIRPFYEIELYRNLLSTLPVTTPGLVGAWSDEGSGSGLLILEYLDGASVITKRADYVHAMELSAIWSASFHLLCAERMAESRFIAEVDLELYRTSCNRVVNYFSTSADGSLTKSLSRIAERFDAVLDIVSEAPRSVIHGEFYPKNILIRGDVVYPVDWETARVGMPELDIATLLEGGFERDVIDGCLRAYHRARGDGSLREIIRRFTAGQMLMDVYWLGLYPESEVDENGDLTPPWRLRHFVESARRLGIA